jgi:hypothetical protein
MSPSRLRTRKTALALAAALSLGAAPWQRSQAAACSFNPASGNWAVSGNWSCAAVPSAPPNDSASIATGQTVVVDSAQSIRTLFNAGLLRLDAFLLDLQAGAGTVNTGVIQVGGSSTAALQINGGHPVDNTGGVIRVLDGSVAHQFGSSITGGVLETMGSGAVVAHNSSSNFLQGVTLNGTLDLASNAGVERVAGGLTLNGTVRIGNNAILAAQGTQTIDGHAAIVFVDGSGANRFNLEAGDLTLGSDVVVRGGNGVIGQQAFVGGASTLTNHGAIQADEAGRTITLGLNGLTTNHGTLAALNGGTLLLNSAVNGASGSQIQTGAGSVVLQNGVTLGGELSISGAGAFRASNNGNNFLNGVRLSGTLDLDSDTGTERAAGGLTLSGATIRIGKNSVFAAQGDQTIGGTGTFVFSDGSSANRLNVEAGNLVLGPGVTVRGHSGTIGQQVFVGGAASLSNQGTIAADVAGGTVSLQVNGLVSNQGTLAARNGGTLVLNAAVDSLPGSVIEAGAGSTVLQNGVTLSGTIQVAGGGSFRPSNTSLNLLSGAAFTGNIDLASAQGVERVANGLNLEGTVRIGADSIWATQGNQTLGGHATIVFADNSGSNRFNVEAGDLVLGPDVLVRGGNGFVGQQAFAGGAATVRNNGTVQADVAGTSIQWGVNGLTTNAGTLAALNGGTLSINSPVDGTADSRILAGAGSTVIQNGVTLSGVMNLAGPGSIRASGSSNNVLSGVRLSGTLDLASAGGVERVVGGLTLDGATVAIGHDAVFAAQGNQLIGGTGSLVFADDGFASNRFNVEAGVLTLGPGVTVRGGYGVIGQQAFAGGDATLVNQGLITADRAGRTIAIGVSNSVSAGVVNQATLKAENGGTLLLQNMAVDNTAGQLLAGNDSTVALSNLTLTGGQLNTAGNGRFSASNGGNVFVNGATLNGRFDMASTQGILRVSDGGMVLNGRIDIGKDSVLATQGTQTLGGTGEIVFADGQSANRLNIETGALTLGAGVTVHGQQGQIGPQAFVGGPASLNNLGTINADGGGVISINPNGALSNDGLFRAQAGTLAVQRALTGAGTLQVDTPGVMNLANGGNSQGRLLMGAAGAALNLGSGNLTIGADYSNAGAGTGNNFDRRAGVSGTGLIVAGGDVAQVISGAQVMNGSTPDATLTLGNVRVGSTTFNYQIGNAGTVGPILRGAIQTAAHGGNLIDPRLSGSGVTASNFDAGGPGSHSGDLAVTFTTGSAGVLAPLSGQVLNLRSNFENLPDQKLNIVLGAGAAAYNAAVGSTVSPVQVANQRVGGTASRTLAITNTAAPGAFSEDLNVSRGAVSGSLVSAGSIAGRLAGSSSGGGAITVGVDTTTAGARSGSLRLDYQTAGAVAGVSNGLGLASAGSQSVAVTGNVYQPAAGALQTPALNFGTLQVGQSVNQPLVVRNVALGPAGFVEDLQASFGTSGNSQITGSGTLHGIEAGSNSNAGNGSLVVTVLGATPGSLNSSITVNYASAGTVRGVSNGLGVLPVGSESFGVSGSIEAIGTVINQASPHLGSPAVDLGAVRVGAVAPTAFVSLSNLSTAAPQAALNASLVSGGAPITAGGSISLLEPGQTNNTHLQVGLSTATAGNYTGANAGSAILNLVSDASNVGGCDPNCALTLPSQTVTVSGKVYTTAQGQVVTPSVDFGIVRVGDTVSARHITVRNDAAVTALNDTLRSSVTGLSGPLVGGTPVANIVAQDNGQLAVMLDTHNAGVFSQSATVGFASHNADMADAAAGPDTSVAVTAQVNNLANADFDLLTGLGLLSDLGAGTFVLDLGRVALGQSGHWQLQIDNEVSGPADLLRGEFDLIGADDFAFAGWDPLAGLAAGQAQDGLSLDFSASRLGSFEDTVAFRGFSFNASDPDGLSLDRRLIVRATVFDPDAGGGPVPEPATLALLLLGLCAAARAKSARAAPASHQASSTNGDRP